MMTQLDGLVVLDCSLGDAGPRASGMLADYGAEIAPHRLAPDLGRHTDEVLAMLGFSDDVAAALRAAGKIR
jgi:crotonobetainyl-CoA:carnitine CoA-transferase CaiB-like acyl-CoA transferase